MQPRGPIQTVVKPLTGLPYVSWLRSKLPWRYVGSTDGWGQVAEQAHGAAGTVLTSNGENAAPSWQSSATLTQSSPQMVVFDFTTDCATGDGKFYLHIDDKLNGMNLVRLHAEVITAGTTGTMDIQVHNINAAVDMLSTKLTVDSGETGSDTATPYVINTANDDVQTNEVLRIDVDAVHTTPAKGLIVTLTFEVPAASTEVVVQMVVTDFLTNTATGDGQFYLHIDDSVGGMNLVRVHAEVITAGTTNTLDIQIHNVDAAVDMLSTKLTVDSGETGSDTAAAPAVINAANDDVQTNEKLRIDIDAVHTTPAKGLIVTLVFDTP